MKLEAIISADLSRLERDYDQAVSASKATARQIDDAFKNSPQIKFGTARQFSQEMSAAASSAKQSGDIIKESIESVSSELIESFGIDGDVANMLANELVKVRLSTLLLGGAAVGAVAGIAYLTAAMAENAAELRSTAQLLGISTDQLQKYQNAASAAGADADSLTDAIKDLRDQAKDALKGNVEVAETFRLLGISAADAAKNASPAFERFLDVLETVPDAQTRIAIAQKVLGNASDDTLKTILALTDANGELRDRVNELSIAMDKQSVEELAKLNRDWDVFTTKAGIFGKQVGLGVVKTLQYLNQGFEDMDRAFNGAGDSTDKFSKQQGNAASVVNQTTEAIRAQQQATEDLARALARQSAAAQIEGIQKEVSGRLLEIAAGAKDAKAAVGAFQQQMARDDDFYAAIGRQKQFKDNMEALNKLVDPDDKKKKTRSPRVAAPASTVTAINQTLNAELALEAAFARRGIELARAEADAELAILNGQLEDRIISLKDYYAERRLLEKESIDREIAEQDRIVEAERKRMQQAESMTGDQIAALLAAKPQGKQTAAQRAAAEQDRINKIINLENQLQATLDQHNAKIIASETQKQALQLQGAEQLSKTSREQVQANREIEESFRQIQIELLRATGQDVEASGAELGQRFAEAMAKAIREGRTDVVDAINQITEIERARAESRQLQQDRSAIQSGMDAQQAAIQNRVAQGLLTETAARKEEIKVLEEGRQAILATLLQERARATSIGDAGAEASISAEIEKINSMGREIEPGFRTIEEELSRGLDNLVNTLMTGTESFTDVLKNFATSLVSDIARELQSSLIESLTGGAASSIGQFLGKTITNFFGGLFGFRASGGPVSAGAPYIVGEEGPEMFVPRTAGYVMNAQQTAGAAGSGTVVNQYNTFQISAPDGRVSRETQNQVASKAASSLGKASRRNN